MAPQPSGWRWSLKGGPSLGELALVLVQVPRVHSDRSCWFSFFFGQPLFWRANFRVSPALPPTDFTDERLGGSIGEGAFRNDEEKKNNSIRYPLGLGCVDVLNVGCETLAEMDDLAARVKQVERRAA